MSPIEADGFDGVGSRYQRAHKAQRRRARCFIPESLHATTNKFFVARFFLCHRLVKHDDQRDEFRAFTMTSHKLHLAVRGDARDDILQGRTCETGIARMSMRSTSSINLR